jgi:hypothetical protein
MKEQETPIPLLWEQGLASTLSSTWQSPHIKARVEMWTVRPSAKQLLQSALALK